MIGSEESFYATALISTLLQITEDGLLEILGSLSTAIILTEMKMFSRDDVAPIRNLSKRNAYDTAYSRSPR